MERSAESLLVIVRGFVEREKGKLTTPINLDTPLLDGVVDSFGLIELAEEIGKAFALPALSEDLLPEDFESARKLWGRIQEVES